MLNRENLHIRDPFVHIENGVYYVLGTTGDDSWGRGSNLTLYTSRDLEDFSPVCKMVEEHYLESYTNIWAPELHRYQGKYYLIVSLYREDLGRGSIIFVSDSLTEKFVPLTGEYITPKQWGCLDATLFVWKDKPYLFFSYEWTTPEGDGSIYVAELSQDLKQIVGAPRRVVNGKTCGFSQEIQGEGCCGYVAEGPYVVTEAGKIALYWSTFTETGYSVAKNVADDIFGTYEFEKIVFAKDGGHCMIFTDLQGKRQMTFHQPNVSPNERMKLFAMEK